MHETICCGCDVYKLAKITTILELITGNWILLAVEFYGILKKKYTPVIIVLILRVICVILGILLGILFLAISEVLVDLVDGIFKKNYGFSFYEFDGGRDGETSQRFRYVRFKDNLKNVFKKICLLHKNWLVIWIGT